LGYITEDPSRIYGHHATISDLPACKIIARKLHGLRILHGDLNKHNFLISERGVVLIDFETAKRSGNGETMEKEVEGLEEQLQDDSGTGGVVLEEEDNGVQSTKASQG